MLVFKFKAIYFELSALIVFFVIVGGVITWYAPNAVIATAQAPNLKPRDCPDPQIVLSFCNMLCISLHMYGYIWICF
jgi:hypothetical protein